MISQPSRTRKVTRLIDQKRDCYRSAPYLDYFVLIKIVPCRTLDLLVDKESCSLERARLRPRRDCATWGSVAQQSCTETSNAVQSLAVHVKCHLSLVQLHFFLPLQMTTCPVEAAEKSIVQSIAGFMTPRRTVIVSPRIGVAGW